MELARDLPDFLNKYGVQLADAAAKRLVPLFQPGKDKLPDLSVLEQLRTNRHPGCIKSNKPFRFFPPQVERIAGTVAALKERRTAWMVCEMATGKTAMGSAAAWLMLKHKPDYRLMVMCPGHLVKKWKRELDWLLPHIDSRVVMDFQDLLAFQSAAKTSKRPMAMVIGKDTCKLGVELSHPCAAKRKGRYFSTGQNKEVEIDLAVCPTCGTLLTVKDTKEDTERPRLYDEYVGQDNPERCEKCGDMLATNYRQPGRYPKPHIDRYIQRHMNGVFDLLIADEVHELAAADSAQGNAFGTLASACKYAIALTGTLIGGKANDLHAPLWRMAPQFLIQRGFVLRKKLTSKRSAIARNERGFIRRYGVMEQKVTRNLDGESGGRVSYGRGSRRKQFKSEEHPKPGISPDLFNHFLLSNAVFMSLSELGPALPSLERVLVPVKPSEELAKAYRHVDRAFADAIREYGPKAPTLGALRVQVLDAFLDKPWGWNPIKAPMYDEGVKEWITVTVPPDLGALHEDEKDRKLLEIVQAELAAGRRCCIYPQYTGVHDVRPKLMAMLIRHGIRVIALPDKIKPIDREAWIEQHQSQIEVLIAHPKRVMTGLDLIGFPSLIWYQCGYSTHVLRQASARARRPTQTLPCKLFYLYYDSTMQEQAMSYMGEKESASLALEGVFDCEALRALMNGGSDDDVLSALAHSLDKARPKVQEAWAKAIEADMVTADVHGGEFLFDLEVTEEVLFG